VGSQDQHREPIKVEVRDDDDDEATQPTLRDDDDDDN
jgi:hypothetical protein